MKIFDIFPFVSFLFFLIILSGKIYFLRKQQIQVGSKSEKFNIQKYILYLPFLLILILWIIEIIKPFLNISFLPEILSSYLFASLLLQITGAIFVLFSLIILLFTLVHFKKSLRFGLNSQNLGKLITTGVFSISRNPFFVSIELYFIGIAIILPNLFLFGFSVVALIGVHFFILKEEKFMRENYGADYKIYCEKVRRYF